MLTYFRARSGAGFAPGTDSLYDSAMQGLAPLFLPSCVRAGRAAPRDPHPTAANRHVAVEAGR